MSKKTSESDHSNASEKPSTRSSASSSASSAAANAGTPTQHAGRQTRRSLRTESKKEARRRALLIEKRIIAGEYKHQRRAPLLTDVVEQYLENVRIEGKSPKTISKYKFCRDLLMVIAKQNKKLRIDQIDVALVQAFRASRAAGGEGRKPSSPKTLHNDTVTIRQLVNFALKFDMVNEDPLRGLKLKKPKRPPQPCWTRSEVDRILAAANGGHKAPLVFLAETGARVGEAKWLTWADVDLEHRLIHIRPKDGWRPKSGDERAIPINDRLHDLLSELSHEGNWVFNAPVSRSHPEPDRQISERRLLQYLKRVLKRLSLKGHLHTFRHSFISFAAIQGVPERVLRKWIGHVDREVLDWYFHLADPESRAAMPRSSDAANATQQTDANVAQSQHNAKGEQNGESAK